MSDELLAMFTARVERDGESLTIDVPGSEVTIGPLEAGATYRVALLPAGQNANEPRQPAPLSAESEPEPPVAAGEVVELEIEDLGDKGDGVARIDSGYVVFVPDTTLGERVTVEITEARETMAFAEVIGRQDR
ncbi:MAG: TRAM domain-containing protein [Halobacteriales archaeon]|nr:TRAM domain-containing protein [Halobacteriales archaeon]